jgi:arylsulfatase A-like enzyme
LPAKEPIQRANRWIEEAVGQTRDGPVFAFIHVRGAHPPWDVAREEAAQLKPRDYAGIVDPRRGGMILSGLRGRRQRGGRRLLDDDWTRLRALALASLSKQDQALAELVAQLKRNNVWDQTLLMITGDVGPGEHPDLPFDPRGPLSEERLIVPLIIKFPENSLAGKEIQSASAAEDLAVTLLSGLGLRVPKSLTGADLALRAQGRDPLGGITQVATLPDRYAARLGQWLLRGQNGRVPSLCALDIDPACVSDVFEKHIIAARALWQATFWTLNSASKLAPPIASRRVISVDQETVAALSVWGD